MREVPGRNSWRAHLLMSSLLIAALAQFKPAFAAEMLNPAPVSGAPTEEMQQAIDALPVPRAAQQVYRLIARNEDSISGGSAFLVSGKRVVVTSYHVIAAARGYTLGYVDMHGHVGNVGLSLLATYPQKDLALLEAHEDLPGNPLPLAVNYPSLGSDVFGIGFPTAADQLLGSNAALAVDLFTPSVVKGIVSRITADTGVPYQLQHQAPITPGYSGGPLIDTTGAAIGVSSAVNKEAAGISYGVAAPDLANFLTACSLATHPVHLSTAQAPLLIQAAVQTSSEVIAPPTPAIEAALRRADALLGEGDVIKARYLFEYAVRLSDLPVAYEGLAKTYDPIILNPITWRGALADAGKAREFYEKAGHQYTDEQPVRIQPAQNCNKSVCSLLQKSGAASVLTCRKSG